MKKLMFSLSLILLSVIAHAGAGIWSSAILMRVNSSVQYYYTSGPADNRFGPTQFTGNLGSFVGNNNQLQIGGGGIRTFKDNNGNVCNGTLFYTVYPAGNRPASPTFSTKQIDFSCNCVGNQFSCTSNSPCSGNDQTWQTASPTYTDITSGLPIGNYVLEIYYSFSGSTTNNSSCIPDAGFDSNTGANYTATFSISSVLPLQLLSFSAISAPPSTRLAWKVSDNEEAAQFEVERKQGTSPFQTIAAIPAQVASGTQSYSYSDNNIQTSSLYRLKILFRSGQIKYSAERRVAFKAADFEIGLVGNPVRSELVLSVRQPVSSAVQIRVINAQGAIVARKNHVIGAGDERVSVNVMSLPAGMYNLQVSNGSGMRSVSFVKK